MAISLVAVGQKWTATIANLIITAINAAGVSAFTPTSVAGAGVSLSGSKVIVSGATSASVNGCFTASADWYTIEYDLTMSAGAGASLALRLAGTDAATAYDTQRLNTVSTTATAAQTLNGTSFIIDPTAIAGRHSGTVKLYGPALAVQTTGTALTGMSANPMTATNAGLLYSFLSHRTLTAYDGFTFSVAAGTMTGTIRVYAMVG